jgi:nucleoside-diphosphate-sugar epimerase
VETVVIFGGAGFIGTHFAVHLLSSQKAEKLILADLKSIDEQRLTPAINGYLVDGRVEHVFCDVRKPIVLDVGDSVSLIANFAAIHREPGHKPFEYYETNILGAENVCSWATQIGCSRILFTSSIAPYGPSETEKCESSIPVPETPYGGSKLVAEKINIAWHNLWPCGNQLVIVRPGVVFGPGEMGNVSRLVRAVMGGYFVFIGNKDTRKAGVYVKELTSAMLWALDEGESKCKILNVSMNPGPSVEEYVSAISDVASVKKTVLNMPFLFVYLCARVLDLIFGIVKIDNPVSPIRVMKLVRSNNIKPKYMEEKGYEYMYTLAGAMRDWKTDRPDEWRGRP